MLAFPTLQGYDRGNMPLRVRKVETWLGQVRLAINALLVEG